MTTDKKPSGPFRAEDFDDSRFKKLKENEPVKKAMATAWEWAALRANARLEPLMEALESFERGRGASADIRAWDEEGNAVVRALRALRDREVK